MRTWSWPPTSVTMPSEFHTRESFSFDYEKLRRMRQEGRGDICALVTGRLYTEGGYSLLDDDPAVAEGAMAGLKTYIESASRLGVDIVLGWAKEMCLPAETGRHI